MAVMMSGLSSLPSARARDLARALPCRVNRQRRWYFATPPSLSTTIQKLRAIAGRFGIKDAMQHDQDPAQKQTKDRAQLHKETRDVYSGNFFTISMKPHEWKDPFLSNEPSRNSAYTTTKKEPSRKRDYTAADAAEHYRSGACFAAWPVDEDGGDWRSVHANLAE
ncbi:hypothetical protein VM1G_03325 [Cytospora mali]|uniref:Uncharacterized protein n=1 Tax=Cytospora mali TaxID=578113 RepID=A0A194VUB1_CYTMA|nr:hypothetical protein VM1G_03325 [Valsa mali]